MLVLMISTIAVAHFNRDVEFRHSVSSNDSSNGRLYVLYVYMYVCMYVCIVFTMTLRSQVKNIILLIFV
jgi:hypothetical protein